MVKSIVNEILSDFVTLFFPRYCLACNGSLVKGETVICTHCMLEMPQTNHHLDSENSLCKRLSIRIPLKYGMALFRFTKSGNVQTLLHSLKYRNHPEIGVVLGKMYGEKLQEFGYHRQWDLIIPIPLHTARARKRGYNQSGKFAEGLSEKLHVPFSERALKRNRKTETQTKKSKLKRWENVETVFEVMMPEEISNQRILLVDDVVTTGATIEACVSVLLGAGCREVSIACIAEA